jgi:hypothetical protein
MHELPESAEAQHVDALADVLVSIHADLTGALPDDGGEFRP